VPKSGGVDVSELYKPKCEDTLLSVCNGLSKLRLNNDTLLRDAYSQYAPNWTSLAVLKISCQTRHLLDVELLLVAEHCHCLVELSLLGCQRVSDVGVSAVLRASPGIVRLSFIQCSSIRDECIESAAKCLTRLEHITVDACERVTTVSVTFMICKCHKHIKTVTLVGAKYSVCSIYHLVVSLGCPQLEEIDLNGQLLSEDKSGRYSDCRKMAVETRSRVGLESKKKSGCIVS
jgi:hypothetical protein